MSTSGKAFTAEAITKQSAGTKTLLSYNAPSITFNNYPDTAAAGGSQDASGSWSQTANYV